MKKLKVLQFQEHIYTIVSKNLIILVIAKIIFFRVMFHYVGIDFIEYLHSTEIQSQTIMSIKCVDKYPLILCGKAYYGLSVASFKIDKTVNG